VGHVEDIFRVLDSADLSHYEWQWMEHAARVGGNLYRAMYDEMPA
jgi:hypothetical protein